MAKVDIGKVISREEAGIAVEGFREMLDTEASKDITMEEVYGNLQRQMIVYAVETARGCY